MSKSLYPKSYQLIYPFKKWNGWGPNQTYCTNQRCLNLHQKNIDELLYIHPIGQAPPSTDLHCKTTKAMQSTNEHISTDEIWWLEATVSQKKLSWWLWFWFNFWQSAKYNRFTKILAPTLKTKQFGCHGCSHTWFHMVQQFFASGHQRSNVNRENGMRCETLSSVTNRRSCDC